MDKHLYQGTCFCGAVKFTVSGEPAQMGYCHCASCRHWSAGPVNAFTLWAPDAVRVVAGADHIASYNKSELSHRKFCSACGGHLYTVHPPWKLIDVYAAIIPGLPFQPRVHVNYGATLLRMRDGLPKFNDLPREMGGTGELVAD